MRGRSPFFLARRISSASGSKPGAMIPSHTWRSAETSAVGDVQEQVLWCSQQTTSNFTLTSVLNTLAVATSTTSDMAAMSRDHTNYVHQRYRCEKLGCGGVDWRLTCEVSEGTHWVCIAGADVRQRHLAQRRHITHLLTSV